MCLGIPGRVVSKFESFGQPMGKVDFGGVVKDVCLAYIPEIEVGEYTIVHVGFAIGPIGRSGWNLRASYREFDARHRFAVADIVTEESPACRSGDVLQGLLKPNECEVFGTACAPRTPLGADHPSMVVARTAFGASRVVAMPLGEQLPRIC
jgi:hydrogenase assembly chaperone HypC/HupF